MPQQTREDSTGMTPPTRNMLTHVLATLMVAAFESILRQQVNDDVHSADNEREERPFAAWTTVENPTTERVDLRRDSAVDTEAAAGIRHEGMSCIRHPAKRGINSSVFAAASIMSADSRRIAPLV